MRWQHGTQHNNEQVSQHTRMVSLDLYGIICIEGKINYWYHILVFISSPNSTASLSAIGINQNIKQKKDTFDQTIEIFKEDKTCIKEESYIGGTHPILMVNNTAPSESKNEIEVASNEEKQVTNVSAVQFQCI